MDPDAALKRIIDAAVTGDAVEFDEAADALRNWLVRGGFPPKDPR